MATSADSSTAISQGSQATLAFQHCRALDANVDRRPAFERAELQSRIDASAGKAARLCDAFELWQIEMPFDDGGSSRQFFGVDLIGRAGRHGARIIVTHPRPVKEKTSLNLCFPRA